jgi:hypothetical protein
MWPFPPPFVEKRASQFGCKHFALIFVVPSAVSTYSSSLKCCHTAEVFLRLFVPLGMLEVLAEVEEVWELLVNGGVGSEYV